MATRKSARSSRVSTTKPTTSTTKPTKPTTKPTTSTTKTTTDRPDNKLPLRGIFRKIGLYGWDEIEVPILASALARLPILLVGSHGSSKTEAVHKIASLFFEDPTFRSYEASNVSIDDLVGYPDPSSLKQGMVNYIPTPLSIWGADVVLFDEINRANPFTQSKLHEVIRSRKINGMDTSVKVVFSSVNPLKKYSVTAMDLALASRFMVFDVPSLADLTSSDIDEVISCDVRNWELPDEYPEAFRKARKLIKKIDRRSILPSLVKEIVKNVPSFSGRQAVNLSLSIRALYSLEKVFDFKADIKDVVNLVVASIPECHGIVAESIDKNRIVSIIRDILMVEDCKELAKKLADSEYNNEASLILDSLISNEYALMSIADEARKNNNHEMVKAAEVRIELGKKMNLNMVNVTNYVVRAVYAFSRKERSLMGIVIDKGNNARLITTEGEVFDLEWSNVSRNFNAMKVREVLGVSQGYDIEMPDISFKTVGDLIAENILHGRIIDLLFENPSK